MTIKLRSPIEASHVYGAAGSPRQRHVFIVRFTPHGAAVAPGFDFGSLTFVIKHCDRPKISVKNEELSQYNKKRHIYTGFKYEPIKMTFYDSASGAAQNMWTAYARYYFGDFAIGANTSYNYDVTTPAFLSGSGFGLSQGYGSNVASNDSSAQWFFKTIEIFHFYVSGSSRQFDSYLLSNPRITSYEPDDLDYENGNVAQIAMQFVYENLQYTPGQQVSNASFEEFTSGDFFGKPVIVTTPPPSSADTSNYNPTQPTAANLNNMFSQNIAVPTIAAPYRNVDALSTGSLSSFGQYSFGQSAPFSLPSTNGAQADVSTGAIQSALSTQYGPVGGMLSQALASNPSSQITTSSLGASMSPSGLSAFNAQQTGTAQYGFSSPVIDTGSFDNLA